MQEININEAQLEDPSSSSMRIPTLLPPHLWNLPYITISPEILEAASIIDPGRVSQLFEVSASAPSNPLATATTSRQPRLHFPIQPITPFDGTPANLRPFCSQLVNQIQGESSLTEAEKVRFAYQCLGTGALAKMRSSFRCLEDSSIPQEITTLDEFLVALKQRCEDPSLRDQATTRVEGLYQKTMKFHDFITTFEDNMVDSIYCTVDKSHWKLMLERRLSPQLRSLILSASDVPVEYHAFVSYLRRKDAGLQEIIASTGLQSPQPYYAVKNPLLASRLPPPSRQEPPAFNHNLPVSKGGSAMDLDTISRQRKNDGHLTQEAKNARIKLGRCIRCNKSGHIVKFCPLGSQSSSISSVEMAVTGEAQELKD